jgi:hypothetical protein
MQQSKASPPVMMVSPGNKPLSRRTKTVIAIVLSVIGYVWISMIALVIRASSGLMDQSQALTASPKPTPSPTPVPPSDSPMRSGLPTNSTTQFNTGSLLSGSR